MEMFAMTTENGCNVFIYFKPLAFKVQCCGFHPQLQSNSQEV